MAVKPEENMENALKGIVLVAYHVAAEEAQRIAERDRKTYESVEESTRNMDEYHIFAMFPSGARPWNYLDRYNRSVLRAADLRDAYHRQHRSLCRP